MQKITFVNRWKESLTEIQRQFGETRIKFTLFRFDYRDEFLLTKERFLMINICNFEWWIDLEEKK
jgi:hypothetical protein